MLVIFMIQLTYQATFNWYLILTKGQVDRFFMNTLITDRKQKKLAYIPKSKLSWRFNFKYLCWQLLSSSIIPSSIRRPIFKTIAISNLENSDWWSAIQSNSDKVIDPVALTKRKRIPQFIVLISCFFSFSYHYHWHK